MLSKKNFWEIESWNHDIIYMNEFGIRYSLIFVVNNFFNFAILMRRGGSKLKKFNFFKKWTHYYTEYKLLTFFHMRHSFENIRWKDPLFSKDCFTSNFLNFEISSYKKIYVSNIFWCSTTYQKFIKIDEGQFRSFSCYFEKRKRKNCVNHVTNIACKFNYTTKEKLEMHKSQHKKAFTPPN